MDFGGGNGGGGGGGGRPEQWFYNLPPVSRIWLGMTTLLTICVNMDVVKWNHIDFAQWKDVVGHHAGRVEVWR